MEELVQKAAKTIIQIYMDNLSKILICLSLHILNLYIIAGFSIINLIFIYLIAVD